MGDDEGEGREEESVTVPRAAISESLVGLQVAGSRAAP